MKKVHIYMVQYPESDLIYIGSTVDVKSRTSVHNTGGTQMYGKIRKKKKDKITLTILEVVENKERLYWERFYMEYFKFIGAKLKNKQRIINSNIIRYEKK